MVAEVSNFFSAFFNGPFVIFIAVFEVDVADEKDAEEGGKRKVTQDFRSAKPLSGEGIPNGCESLPKRIFHAAGVPHFFL